MTIPGFAPNPIDIHVGARVRQLRKQQGLSQTDLAEALGLTFQQVQKYERGANRISASKLFEIGRFLNVRVAYFFEGTPTDDDDQPIQSEAAVNEFLTTSEGIELASTFPRIPAPNHRRKILSLVVALAEGSDA